MAVGLCAAVIAWRRKINLSSRNSSRGTLVAAPPANHRRAVGLLPLLREEFRLHRAYIDLAFGLAAPGGLTSGSAMPV